MGTARNLPTAFSQDAATAHRLLAELFSISSNIQETVDRTREVIEASREALRASDIKEQPRSPRTGDMP